MSQLGTSLQLGSASALPASPLALNTTAAPSPSRAEVERKLSVRSPIAIPRDNARRHKMPSASPQIGSGNESDSSVASSSLPPLVMSPTVFNGGHFVASPATASSPVTSSHAGLSALSQQRTPIRRGTSYDPNAPELELEGIGEGDEEDAGDGTEDDDASADGQTEMGSGLEGERTFKSGFLIKKQERRKQWKKKWFVLRTTRLAYYKDNREYSLSRAIDLRAVHQCVQVSGAKGQKHPFAFAIVTADKTFMVEALSAEERDDWIHVINNARKRLTEKDDESRRQNGESRAVAVPVPRPVDHHDSIDTHQGTWMSIASSTGVSTTSGYGGYPHSHRTTQSASFQASSPITVHGHPGHPGHHLPLSTSLNAQMANMNISPATPSAPSPSAATVNRRLSNPIIPPPSLQIPKRNQSVRREVSGSSTDTPIQSQQGQSYTRPALSNSLNPPYQPPQFISSDEEDAYFSDPNAAWTTIVNTEPPQPIVSDPTKIILATYLMKKSRKTTREVWRKRWFVLTSAGITYTKSHMDTRAITTLPIGSVLDVFSVEEPDECGEIDSSDTETKQPTSTTRHQSLRAGPKREGSGSYRHIEHVIRVVTPKRRYDLCVPSEEEEIKWIAAIRALVNRERERQTPSTPISPRVEAQLLTGSAHPPSQSQGQTQSTVPTISQQPPTPGSTASSTSPGTGTKGNSPPQTQPPTSWVPVQDAAPATPTPPAHKRSRSATQTAKNAVAEVVRRYNESR